MNKKKLQTGVRQGNHISGITMFGSPRGNWPFPFSSRPWCHYELIRKSSLLMTSEEPSPKGGLGFRRRKREVGSSAPAERKANIFPWKTAPPDQKEGRGRREKTRTRNRPGGETQAKAKERKSPRLCSGEGGEGWISEGHALDTMELIPIFYNPAG